MFNTKTYAMTALSAVFNSGNQNIAVDVWKFRVANFEFVPNRFDKLRLILSHKLSQLKHPPSLKLLNHRLQRWKQI
ncbi:MAG: hypothetical protein DWQ06_10480 [Calditrichaeota bacterium]|nr:MAG: hypothetical protein DWQ06_10480 [Calditrichota bacterium]